jgi:O-antigen/teichoic acid export membrane protein
LKTYNLIRKVLQLTRNKIILYAISRYFILAISFITSLILAAKLGPYYYGIWGFILLILNYFQYFDFGVSDSCTILLVQNKNDISKVKDYEINSIIILSVLNVFILIVALINFIWGISFLDKYTIGSLFYFVCLISIVSNFNKLFFKIYRVKNRVFEFAFYQSINALLVLIVIFIGKEKKLIYFLVSAYTVGHLISLFLFIKGKGLYFGGKASIELCFTILKKGFFLFLYNFFFYLIVISTKGISSVYYTVEEFGFFTFAYTIANAIILLIDAFAVLIVPKVIDKFYSPNLNEIEKTFYDLKINYMYFSYFIMFIIVFVLPILLIIIPKYHSTFQMVSLLSLAVALSTNSFGFSMYLRAKNKENVLALTSFISLAFNVFITLFLVIIVKVSYPYVSISILSSYFLFTVLCVYFGRKDLYQKVSFVSIVKESFPLNLLVPVLITILITALDLRALAFLPLLVFLILNKNFIVKIYNTIIRVLNNSSIFDIKP